VILGIVSCLAVAVFFNFDGALLRWESRPPVSLSSEPRRAQARPDATMVQELGCLIEAWKAELGFEACMVSISEFNIPDLDIGISKLPRFLQDVVDRPESEPERERHEFLRDIEEWRHLDKFVLRWGSEYLMNRAGEVTDT